MSFLVALARAFGLQVYDDPSGRDCSNCSWRDLLSKSLQSQHPEATIGSSIDQEIRPMKIGELGKQADCQVETIRYYERIGLIPPVPRKPNGIRDFDQESCNWIEFIKCMRSAGVQIEALIDYVHLFYQENTAEARKAILVEQRDRLQKQIDTMNLVIERLNKKVDRYEEIIIPAEKKLLSK